MSNHPIQVVLNSDNFLTAREGGGGGSHKDFYHDDPEGFSAHKSEIVQSLTSLGDELLRNEYSDTGYAKIILKRSGWAKSHRPTHKLFKPDIAPVVGAGSLGELFVELTPPAIKEIISKVERAETSLEFKTLTRGDREIIQPDPSRERSELGAIDKIVPYTSSDKRSFSVEQGLKWLTDNRTSGNYIIELFEAPPSRQEWGTLSFGKRRLFESFVSGLTDIGQGLTVQRLTDTAGSYPMLGMRLDKSDERPNLQFHPQPIRRLGVSHFDDNISRHSLLIAFLDKHPLVKKIHLPPIIKRSQTETRQRPNKAVIPEPVDGNVYPQIAIVDGGIAKVLNPWILERWQFLAPAHRDEVHGTFIGGLLVAGCQLNGFEVCTELDGCHLIDIDILPSETTRNSEYFNSPADFLDELANAVRTLKARTGVRIFNFSLNVEQAVESDSYHPFTQRLDQIAQENDVIFVISAGNTNYHRPEWPEDPVQALSNLVGSTNDQLKVPAESVRNIGVGSVNPPHVGPSIKYAPASYSRRGPGLRVGLKPDLAHIGGSGVSHPILGSGLFSIAPNGNVTDGRGTSYATPLVAKTFAALDHAIEGNTTRETLIALAIHHAIVPDLLKSPELKDVARHLVGFGIPRSATDILDGNDHSITLVFSNRLKAGKQMQFSFTWPQSLAVDGRCSGAAKLTLVSSPPLDYKHGVEFVRINMDAALRQEQSDGSYKGRLNPIYLPGNQRVGTSESDLIDYGLKWGPVKAYAKDFPRGVGPSTNWRLDVEYTLRDGVSMPVDGVPFTALLTISDPSAKKPVFNDMRQMLQSIGVETSNIQTASRIMAQT